MTLAELIQQHSQADQPLLVEFWAPWCGPCRAMAPALDQLGGEYAGRVHLVKINADEQPDLLRELKVMAIPTMLVIVGGQVVQRRVGAQSRPALAELFANLAQAGNDPAKLPAQTMDPLARALRLISGLALVILGLWLNNWFLVAAGGVTLLWAVHDRCPLWQALSRRAAPLFNKLRFPGSSQ